MGSVPIEFRKLIDGVIDSSELKEIVNEMIEMKSKRTEDKYINRIDTVDRYIRDELERHDRSGDSMKKEIPDMKALNMLFVEILQEV
jgi:predicted nucleotidyltransferase